MLWDTRFDTRSLLSGQKPIGPKSNIRPPRPHFNMILINNQLEATKVRYMILLRQCKLILILEPNIFLLQ